MTRGHFLLKASDHTPKGMSDKTSVIDMTVARTNNWYAERCASSTKYRPEARTYPRWNTARQNVQRMNVVVVLPELALSGSSITDLLRLRRREPLEDVLWLR